MLEQYWKTLELYWNKYFGLDEIGTKRWFTLAAVSAIAILIILLVFSSKQSDEKVDFDALPDFSSISDIPEMKAAFFNYLRPIADYHNGLIAAEREELLLLQERYQNSQKLRARDKDYISQIAEKYDYDLLEGWDESAHEGSDPHPLTRVLRRLLLRVDEIPMSLTLVQAAKESGWGRSRFAVEANNLFGQWCYIEGCGLVPANRVEGARHEVTRFDSVADAIGSYMNNLNSHTSYETLRLIRGGLRSADEPITGEALADGLIYYSQRREAYVDDIKAMLADYREFESP